MVTNQSGVRDYTRRVLRQIAVLKLRMNVRLLKNADFASLTPKTRFTSSVAAKAARPKMLTQRRRERGGIAWLCGLWASA
jgi:hypothetical protein